MSYRWIGVVLVLAGCGGFGFSMAADHRRQERILRRLIAALRFMQWELQYRLTPLPELCRLAGKHAGGEVGKVLGKAAREMEKQLAPDVNSCMQGALSEAENLPRSIRLLFRELGQSLGRFDLPGQLEGLQGLEKACKEELEGLERGRDQRIRSYETLGLCAGAALVILFI